MLGDQHPYSLDSTIDADAVLGGECPYGRRKVFDGATSEMVENRLGGR